MAILDIISHVHLPSFVNMLPKYLKILHSPVPQLGIKIILLWNPQVHCRRVRHLSLLWARLIHFSGSCPLCSYLLAADCS